ncbi:MAG TPA: hypothetical protein VHA14_14435 [Bryobacteraceae bacterium]|nr:hypothetical protein [Bryobacteraceae bacterium]
MKGYFEPPYRNGLRAELLDLAQRDARICGAAITGSAAMDREDRWSDIDLAFGLTDRGAVDAVIADFTQFMRESHGALHHLDVRAGAWTYRVFFLPGGLQVDLAFVEESEFRPLGETFRIVFGEAKALSPFPEPAPIDLIGMAWLHALHARTCILRGKLWQAEFMISGLRDHVLALACIRLGLPAAHGRGMDQLPRPITDPLLGSLVGDLNPDGLRRALGVVVRALESEIREVDAALADRIGGELELLASAATL